MKRSHHTATNPVLEQPISLSVLGVLCVGRPPFSRRYGQCRIGFVQDQTSEQCGNGPEHFCSSCALDVVRGCPHRPRHVAILSCATMASWHTWPWREPLNALFDADLYEGHCAGSYGDDFEVTPDAAAKEAPAVRAAPGAADDTRGAPAGDSGGQP
jgi:hypothetical protein